VFTATLGAGAAVVAGCGLMVESMVDLAAGAAVLGAGVLAATTVGCGVLLAATVGCGVLLAATVGCGVPGCDVLGCGVLFATTEVLAPAVV